MHGETKVVDDFFLKKKKKPLEGRGLGMTPINNINQKLKCIHKEGDLDQDLYSK